MLTTTSNRWSKRNRGSERTPETMPWQRVGCWGTRQVTVLWMCDCTTERCLYCLHMNNAKFEELHNIAAHILKYMHVSPNYTHTHMYGHTPGTHQELAEQEGDAVRASSLAQQLEEIEERAEELDKQRTKGLSAIRSVAQINVHCHNFVFSVSTSSYTFCLAVLFICGKQYILLSWIHDTWSSSQISSFPCLARKISWFRLSVPMFFLTMHKNNYSWTTYIHANIHM